MSGIYVRKVQRIGGQVVINIPRAICGQLGIEKGDLVAYTEVGEDSAVMVKAKFDRITQLRRQEMLDYGKGGNSAAAIRGSSKKGAGVGKNSGDNDIGGNKGAEGGDGGQDKLQPERNSGKFGDSGGRSEKGSKADDGGTGGDDGGSEGGPEKVAATEDAADKPDDNTGAGKPGADEKGLKLIDEDAGPIDGNVIE